MKSFMFILSLLVVSTVHAQQPAWPDEDPNKWGIAVLDVETTGLEPDYHEMIDLGLIYIDLEGNELGRLFVRIKPDFPDRIGDIARSINGYDIQRWEKLGALSEEKAVAQFLAFHDAYKGERTWIMMAYNAYFDRGFLDALLKEHGSSFRDIYTYFVLDLPSMAWGVGIPDLQHADVANKLGVQPETQDPLQHTGISGAEFNVQLYKALMSTIN